MGMNNYYINNTACSYLSHNFQPAGIIRSTGQVTMVKQGVIIFGRAVHTF